MPSSVRPLRQSVTLSAGVARRVRALARVKRASTSRVIAELVESGLRAQDAERDRFLQLADRLTSSKNRAEQEQIKEELASLTFGGENAGHSCLGLGADLRGLLAGPPDLPSRPRHLREKGRRYRGRARTG